MATGCLKQKAEFYPYIVIVEVITNKFTPLADLLLNRTRYELQ